MPGNLQPLVSNQPIVRTDGTPTEYFIRWAQARQIDISDGITVETATALINELVPGLIDTFAASRQIIAGIGLSGGGPLSSNVTIDADGATVQQDGTDVATGVFKINFTGTGVTVTETAPGEVEVNITGGGGGGDGPHRYWRINITGNNNGYQAVVVAELAFYPTLTSTVRAIGTLSTTYPSPFGAIGNANDGDPFTTFQTLPGGPGGFPVNMTIDLGVGNSAEFKCVGIICGPGGGNVFAPSGFTVDYSDDGVIWINSWTVTGVAAAAYADTIYTRFNKP